MLKIIIIIITALISLIPNYIMGQSGETNKGKATYGDWGIETQFISKTIAPGNDFYSYVNEGWFKLATIPAGASGFSNYNDVQNKVNQRIAGIIHGDVTVENTSKAALQQITALYSGYVNTDNIEKLGLKPIQQDLKHILALNNYQDVAKWMANPKSFSIVSIHASPDLKDRSRFLITLSESGIGLPSPEYYEKQDGPYPGYRKAYKEYIIKTLQLAGISNPEKRANDILDIETQLAAVQWTPGQIRDTKINSTILSVSQLNDYAPGFPWKVFLANRQVENVTELILQADSALKAKAALFAKTPVDVWSSYLAFHWIVNHSTLLPAEFRKNLFDFYSATLSGITKDAPREQKSIQYVNNRLDQLIGKLYAERYFPVDYKQRIKDLVDYLRKAFVARIERLDWLDDSSRKEALAKLDALTVRIGYPDVWRDYSVLKFNANNPVGNEHRIAKAKWDYERSLLTKTFTSKEWYDVPQTVDATSSKLYNSIEFPAGILQPPFFDPFADAAVNFGAIGAIIGHELGHCFDDEGSKFDGNGVMRDWWTPETRKSFEARTTQLVEQYNAFTSPEGIHINGKQTLGENIGDLTGLAVAYEAYQLYRADHDNNPPVLDGYTADQRFFISLAQVSRSLYTPEAYRMAVTKDYHSPAEYRVNGVVRNIDAWYKAFSIKPEDKLYLAPEKRVRIW
ncbi:M13 family metallopeptidase [Flavobacterium chilense]|uniref:Endothelin-converting enzyme/putative endopeptidase n=1 Tax=Flavobacterium chilense TaxID=946677 RepID=A0A1M7LE93_9FLAO|nr:M13 family metallopeptidase [Flavobacterium chilense]SHM75939.1 endothelin-converting enzyme/putative endopeptidase [Flavobacterium chilense]